MVRPPLPPPRQTASTSSTSRLLQHRTPRRRQSAFTTPSSLTLSAAALLLITTLLAILAPIASASPSPYTGATIADRLAAWERRDDSSSSSNNATVLATKDNKAFQPRPNSVDYYNPNDYAGGQMTTIIPTVYTIGLGEPLNVIVSGRSSASVLDPVGFLLWATSVNFGVSCLGQANGTEQETNLGDGRGNVTQGTGSGENGVLRYNYGDPYLGTCSETFKGGNHFRWWVQNGTQANSSAIFIAASLEEPLAQNHNIQTDGYNRGRDELVGNATLAEGTEWEGNKYNTTVVWVPAGLLLNATSDGINHPDVALPGQPAQDGRVAVLTITQLAGSASESGMASRMRTIPWTIMSLPSLLAIPSLSSASWALANVGLVTLLAAVGLSLA